MKRYSALLVIIAGIHPEPISEKVFTADVHNQNTINLQQLSQAFGLHFNPTQTPGNIFSTDSLFILFEVLQLHSTLHKSFYN